MSVRLLPDLLCEPGCCIYLYIAQDDGGCALMNLTLLLQELIIGVATGAIYALIALGYTMVYGIIELINFAHGDIFMIGTFVSITIFNWFGITSTSQPTGFTLVGILLVTLLGSMVFCAVLGVVIERVAYRRLRNAPRLAPLFAAVAVYLILGVGGKIGKVCPVW